ncbi:hypothetical protein [Candidatus Halobonum tyrrellensis]|uniref:hypothetical protein n=1 Tax=Candidatus Halobonum tyrrellensis TaxID=1431545 RepID=UPI00126811A1|nr:hypothetical protein [Candidatus Halobonum tyrrellensis]
MANELVSVSTTDIIDAGENRMPQMATRETWYVGVALLLLGVLAVAVAIVIAGIYTTVPVSLSVFVAALIMALVCLYGFYKVMATLVDPTPLNEQSITK